MVATDKHVRSAIVIGAGAAGLSCATTLRSHGVRVTLIEASSRIGGRCHTECNFGNMHGPCELGATWVHGTVGNPAHTLCDSLGLLPRQPRRQHPIKLPPSPLYLRVDGSMVNENAVRSARRVLKEAVAEAEGGSESASAAPNLGAHVRTAWAAARPQLLARHGVESAALLDAAWAAAEQNQCAIDGCADLADQSGGAAYSNFDDGDGRNIASRPDLGGPFAIQTIFVATLLDAFCLPPPLLTATQLVFECLVCRSGFSAAMEALAAPLRESGVLHMSSTVSLVSWGDAGGSAEADGGGKRGIDKQAKVWCANGETHSADACVITIPLNPLRSLTFEPPLLPVHRDAMDTFLGMGQVEKLFVAFEERSATERAAGDGDGDGDGNGDGDGGCDGEGEVEASSSGRLSNVGEAGFPTIHFLWTDADDDDPGDGAKGPDERPRAASASWVRGLHILQRTFHEANGIAAPAEASSGSDSDGRGSDSSSSSDEGGVFGCSGGVGVRRRHTLVGWLTGEAARAVSGRPSEELLPELATGLAPFFARRELGDWQLVACHASSWCAQPNYRGAYTYPRVGAPADVASQLSTPLPLCVAGERKPPILCFAGEATSRDGFGTVGGAMQSGTREAERLLDAWGIEHRQVGE